MTLASTTSAVRRSLRDKELVIAVQASGNYVVGGDTLNLTTITVPIGMENGNIGYPGTIKQWEVISSPAGYQGVLVPPASPNLAGWKLKVLQGGAAVSNPQAELAAAAYPAALLTAGAFFYIRLIGPKLRF